MTSQVQQPMLATCIYQPPLPAVNPVIVPGLAVQAVETKSKHLKFIRIIQMVSLAQGLLGIFCLIIGILSACGSFGRLHTVYEGIWCGSWIAFCGIFGYIGIRQKASRYVINIHLAFSIVGAVMSGTLVSFSVIFTVINYRNQIGVLFLSLAAVVSLVSLGLLITNATYASFLNGNCQPNLYWAQKTIRLTDFVRRKIAHRIKVRVLVGDSRNAHVYANDGGYNNQIIYTQQPIQVQAAGTATFQPGCSAQGYQPMMATTQVAYAQSTPGQMTPTPYNQNLPKADAPNPAQSAATSSGLQEGVVHQPVYIAQGYQPIMAGVQVGYAQSAPGQMRLTPYNQNLPKADVPIPAQSAATSSGLQGVVHHPVYVTQGYQPIMAGVQVGYAQSAPDQMTPNSSAQNSQKQQQDEDNQDELSTPSTESPAYNN